MSAPIGRERAAILLRDAWRLHLLRSGLSKKELQMAAKKKAKKKSKKKV
jgi:hypothetical protein